MPLYIGRDEHGNLYVASEMKALIRFCRVIEDFPPGHYLTQAHRQAGAVLRAGLARLRRGGADRPSIMRGCAQALEAAVHQQLMCDVPYGVLISGGLDSSVIAAIAQRYAPKRVEERRPRAGLVAAPALVRHRPRGLAGPRRRRARSRRTSAPCTTSSSSRSRRASTRCATSSTTSRPTT